MAASAKKFKSRSVSGLLRGAPDLEPYVQNMESLFETPDDGKLPAIIRSSFSPFHLNHVLSRLD